MSVIKWWKHVDVVKFIGFMLLAMAVCFVTISWQQNLLGLALVLVELFVFGFPIRKYGRRVLDLIENNLS